MTEAGRPYYCPALRMKRGELQGLRDLSEDVANFVVPRLIVPPLKERDDPNQWTLFSDPAFPSINSSLNFWSKPTFVEVTYIIDEFGREKIGSWLPKMLEAALNAGARPIPLVVLDDLLNLDPSVFRAVSEFSRLPKLGVVLTPGQVEDAALLGRGLEALGKSGVSANECAVLCDFADADFSDVDISASVVAAILETLSAAARWQQVIFQGTNYPEKNPTEPGEFKLIPRNEWFAWRSAVALDSNDTSGATFGDYGPDCAKIDFGGRGRAPIRHIRYATPEAWRVQRAPDGVNALAGMRQVCAAIVDSGLFAGAHFSLADAWIIDLSKGIARPGSPSTWRAVNTTHHITRVVHDIGILRGATFDRVPYSAAPEQWTLFDAHDTEE